MVRVEIIIFMSVDLKRVKNAGGHGLPEPAIDEPSVIMLLEPNIFR